MQVSIVIVNYNVRDLIIKCLCSIYELTNKNFSFEIIVIDNDSKDDSVIEIKRQFPKVILVESEVNLGFPKANNVAFEMCQGKYIFMLNPDTEFVDDALSNLYAFIEQNNDISILGPALLNTDLSHQQSVWRFPTVLTIFAESFYLKALLKNKNYFDKNIDLSFEAESFSGAAIFFNKDVLNSIGFLDETMFWIEDVEFCYRAKRSNLKLVYLPEVKIIHHIGQSAKKNYNISLSNQVFNKIKFFKKHHSSFDFLIITLISLFHSVFKLMVFAILSPFDEVYKLKAKAYAYTIPRIFNPPTGIK